MKQVSETFVPVVNSVSRLTWLLLPEGATGLFEHYIVNENGKLIRFGDFKAKEHGSMCVTLLTSLVLPNSQRLKPCICTFKRACNSLTSLLSRVVSVLLIFLWNTKGDLLKKLHADLFYTILNHLHLFIFLSCSKKDTSNKILVHVPVMLEKGHIK